MSRNVNDTIRLVHPNSHRCVEPVCARVSEATGTSLGSLVLDPNTIVAHDDFGGNNKSTEPPSPVVRSLASATVRYRN